MRLTRQVLEVLNVLLRAPDTATYGLEVARETGYKTGTIYPILDRLVDAGWLEPAWEKADPQEVKRPRRRYFRLTELGRVEAYSALSEYLDAIRPGWHEDRIPS